MAARPLADVPTDELTRQLAAVRKVHLVITGIFAVIVLTWIVGGYWRQSLPVFVSTVAMSVAITAMQFSMRARLEKELARRGAAGAP
jgi:hypothetical protein